MFWCLGGWRASRSYAGRITARRGSKLPAQARDFGLENAQVPLTFALIGNILHHADAGSRYEKKPVQLLPSGL